MGRHSVRCSQVIYPAIYGHASLSNCLLIRQVWGHKSKPSSPQRLIHVSSSQKIDSHCITSKTDSRFLRPKDWFSFHYTKDWFTFPKAKRLILISLHQRLIHVSSSRKIDSHFITSKTASRFLRPIEWFTFHHAKDWFTFPQAKRRSTFHQVKVWFTYHKITSKKSFTVIDTSLNSWRWFGIIRECGKQTGRIHVAGEYVSLYCDSFYPASGQTGSIFLRARHLTACMRETNKRTGGVWCRRSVSNSNSKHWFTTSFLQPLPYLVTR